MKKNLFQKTVYEVYKSKEAFGYKIVETPQMFIILWNDQSISGLNIVHCEKFSDEEFNFIKKNLYGIEFGIASNIQSEINHPKLKFDEIAQMMFFESSDSLEENKNFEIKLIDNQKKLNLFCELAGNIFHMNKDVAALQKSLAPDLSIEKCDKYIGYSNGIPAGIIEICRGSEAALISWVGVKEDFRKQGLCHAMLAYAINNEIAKGCNKFVLVATETGQKIYSKFGFKVLASRYDYTLDHDI